MSFTLFLQILANVIFATALFVVFARLRRPAKDDPRLSKGLQLLSSKIAVLEDLSDRTEIQVQQMLLLLDQKSKELQSKISLAEQQVAAVRQSMDQSLEVARIFQDKIPHGEIIERQTSVKYIKAARLAHAGVSVADIAREVDLPMGEIEFIAKVNHESLSFREEDLPAWAREPQSHVDHLSMAASIPAPMNERMPNPNLGGAEQEGLVQRLSKLQFEMQNLDLELAHRTSRNILPDLTQAFEPPRVDSSNLERLGEEFRRAVEAAERAELIEKPSTMPSTFSEPRESAEPRHPAHHHVHHYAMTPEREIPAVREAATPSVLSASPMPEASREVSNPELEAARAAAAALRAKDVVANASHASKPNATSSAQPIRRVEFPRI